MKLNKSKGNMYGFVTHTGNVIKGKCPHGCSYCYMKKWGEQPELHFDEGELDIPMGEGKIIFVGSGCDMFAEDIPKEWIEKILDHCKDYPFNTYLFQSKSPQNFFNKWFPENTILCTTVESNRIYPEIMGKTPQPEDRLFVVAQITIKKMITIEPILDFDLDLFIESIKKSEPYQVNIGADSCRNLLPEPPKGKILDLISALSEFTNVHQKENLSRLLK